MLGVRDSATLEEVVLVVLIWWRERGQRVNESIQMRMVALKYLPGEHFGLE